MYTRIYVYMYIHVHTYIHTLFFFSPGGRSSPGASSPPLLPAIMPGGDGVGDRGDVQRIRVLTRCSLCDGRGRPGGRQPPRKTILWYDFMVKPIHPISNKVFEQPGL